MMKQITMTKPHSPHTIVFSSDVDPHFMNIEVKKRATGVTVCSHYILKSDVPQWLSYFEPQGFTIKNSDNG